MLRVVFVFLVWIVRAVVACRYHAVDQDGYPITRQTLGYCVFSTMLLTLTIQIGLHSNLLTYKYHIWFTFVIPLASFFGLGYLYNVYSAKLEVRGPEGQVDYFLVAADACMYQGYDVFNQTLGAAWYWTVVPLLTAISVMPGWLLTFWSTRYNQTDDQVRFSWRLLPRRVLAESSLI